ncbi:MAG TPA: TlpA disulfide reductase family protein [Bacteroidales bacterium]
MKFSPKEWFLNYLKKKKPLSIFIDALFIILVVLLIIPGTRTTVGAFFIRLTSFPPSTIEKGEQLSLGNNVNNWTLYDLEGKTVKFSELNQKPVFVNIWATWCPPCVAEMPGIEEIYQEYKHEVSFILVTNEEKETVMNFLKKNNYEELPVYFASNTPAEFSSNSIPATFVVSRDGRIVVNKKGAARWNTNTTKNLLEQLIIE